MRSYPRTEVLSTFVEKISTQCRLNSTTRCHSLCYGQKIKLNRIDFLHVSNRLRWCLETTSICIESTCIETTELHYESVYKLVTLRSQPPRLLVYMLCVRFPWFFISPSWESQRDWKRSIFAQKLSAWVAAAKCSDTQTKRIASANQWSQWYYIITQVILAFWLVLAYDLLEDRRTDDDSARFKFFFNFLNFDFEPITILC